MNRLIFLLGFLACAALLGYAYYAEYVLFLDPCPLCMLQRIAMIALALMFLLGAIHGRAPRVYAAFATLAASVGAAIATRHVWIQQHPSESYSCGGDWNFLVDTQGVLGAIGQAFTGTGDCANIDWSFLDISMPAWVLIWFLGLGILTLVMIIRPISAHGSRPPPPPLPPETD